MRVMIALLLLVFSAPLLGVELESPRLPLTVDERNAACSEVEDSDPVRAIALADSVLAEALASGPMQRAKALGCRGWAQSSLERREESRRDAHALRSILHGMPTSAERVRLSRRAGGILHRSGDRVGALEQYAQALEGAESLELEVERIPLLVNLGVLHSEFEEHERARVNYEQALALMQRLDDFRYEAPVRFNLALNLMGQDRHADALPHLQRTLELMRGSGMGGARQELDVKLALAGVLQKTGNLNESKRLVDEARAMDATLFDGKTSVELALLDASNLASAGNAQAALDVVDRIEPGTLNEFQHWNLLNQRAELLELLGRYRDAAGVLRQANTLRESYLRHQNHERLAALDSHLRDREQRLELERLQAASIEQDRQMRSNQRLQWIGASIAAFLLLIGAGMLLWQRRMNRRLYLASRTDPLTGLANRRAMAEHLRNLSREPTPTALLLIDIDHFKRINDERGHDIGDDVLVTFAERLRGRTGADALVARWGGEEFLVVLPHSDVESACAMADTLRESLARPIETGHGSLVARVSIGIANLPLPDSVGHDAWHASLQLADSALYLSKRSGRDAWVCYWIDLPIPDWPADRIASESALARSLGIIVPRTSRPIREPVATVAERYERMGRPAP